MLGNKEQTCVLGVNILLILAIYFTDFFKVKKNLLTHILI